MVLSNVIVDITIPRRSLCLVSRALRFLLVGRSGGEALRDDTKNRCVAD